MDYTTHSEDTIKKLLKEIGKSSIAELFSSVPDAILDRHPAFNSPGSTEQELLEYFNKLAMKNNICNSLFMGGGAYNHYTPSIIGHLTSRAEFQTAYTPYQSEISQGTLQTIFEFQGLMADLTKMEISNASLYDGASSAAEAILMAYRLAKGKKNEFLISRLVHPEYLQTIKTYIHHLGLKMSLVDFDENGNLSSIDESKFDWDNIFAFVYQSPNFYGIIEDHQKVSDLTSDKDKLFSICIINEMTSLGLFEPPGKFGTDIVAGEAQALGLPLSYGGPYLGFLTSKLEYAREIPGRLVGATRDSDGERGFVLTLATREQHIRREKATSNICTNQALCALSAAIYLSLLGRNGLYDVSMQSYQKAHYLKDKLSELKGISIPYKGHFYNEFVYEVPGISSGEILTNMKDKGIYAGIPLSLFSPNKDNMLLTAVTENNSKGDIDRYIACLREILA